MADSSVGVKQSTVPDRLIANDTVNVGGQILYRQWVLAQGRPMTAYSQVKTGPLTDSVLVAAGPTERLRILRIAVHCDPATAQGIYPLVTLKLGATTIYHDKLESGFPWSETCSFEGGLGDDLALTLDTGTVYLNIRHEVWT